MKKLVFILSIILIFAISVNADVLRGKDGHEKYLYPTVRVTFKSGAGSGTIIYSKLIDEKSYSTYILTNYHVISSAISISEEWDPNLQKNVKREKRAIVYVEIFRYKDLSTPVGTTKLEADIIVYDRTEDVALVKLRYDGAIEYIADMPDKENAANYKVMDEAVAVGCSLGWPPLVSYGLITRKNYQLDSLPYDMSSAQIIFGNSGGGMYTAEGKFIGIPSRVAAYGWSAVVSHMGLFIPISRIYEWLEREFYDFIYDSSKIEKDRLEERKKDIEMRKKRSDELS